jgi:isopenicillin-N N-acyltransferase-like protein
MPISLACNRLSDVPPPQIPIVRAEGTHREVGLQLGVAGAEQIGRSIDEAFAELPAGRSLEQQRALAADCRAFTEPRLPWLIEELDGVADGAQLDRLDHFACSIEEIWSEPLVGATQGRCSDLVAGPPATADGHLLAAHNNDLAPDMERHITAIEKRVTDDPVVFQLGGIPWLSVGFNSAGLSLTGNELSPNDQRVGISRSHQVLEMIAKCRTLGEMVNAALRPDRASSYNNVLTSSDGGAANVEGSATDAEVTHLDARGNLAHTNHYVCDRMRRFEGDSDYAVKSEARYRRAKQMLADAQEGSITAAELRIMLSDHEGMPNEICRHPENGHPKTKTVFWCVADVTEGRITYGRGNPCDSVAQEYAFDDYAPA